MFNKYFLVSDSYPRRFLDSGESAGLYVKFKSHKKDVDYICKGPVQGFTIILHTPGEVSRTSKKYFRVPVNQEVIVSVKPQMIITDEELSGHAPER